MSSRGVSSQLVQFRLVECRTVSRYLVSSHEVEFSLVSWSAVLIEEWGVISRSLVSARGVSSRGILSLIVGVEFSSVQLKTASMRSEKPICAPPRPLRSFLNVAFETVPVEQRVAKNTGALFVLESCTSVHPTVLLPTQHQ